MSPEQATQFWGKFNESVARRYDRYLPKQKVEKLFRKFQGEEDETRKHELWFRIQHIVAPTATVAFLEEVALMTQRDFDKLVEVIFDSMEKRIEEESRAYLDYESMLKEPLRVIEEAAFTAGLTQKIEVAIAERKSLGANPRLLARLLTFSTIREFGAALAFMRLKPLFDVMEVAKARLSADENWMTAIVALSLEENLLKSKLLQLGLSEGEIRNLGDDFYKLANKVTELIEAKERRRVRMDVLLSSGYRKVRNKVVHEGYLWKPERNETSQIVAHVLKLSGELWPSLTIDH